MRRYRVCVDVTIRRVIDVRAADKHDAANEAECKVVDSFNPREIREISSEVVEDDGTEF